VRRDTDAVLHVDISTRERLICDDMKVATGLRSDADLLRTALFRFAQHLDQKVDTGTFALRRPGRPGRRKRAKAS
jgi:hypothetical protein